jgi:hypothetical protein
MYLVIHPICDIGDAFSNDDGIFSNECPHLKGQVEIFGFESVLLSNDDRRSLNCDCDLHRGRISSFLTSLPWLLTHLDKEMPVLEAPMFMSVDLLCDPSISKK